jgi:hypothetical protein
VCVCVCVYAIKATKATSDTLEQSWPLLGALLGYAHSLWNAKDCDIMGKWEEFRKGMLRADTDSHVLEFFRNVRKHEHTQFWALQQFANDSEVASAFYSLDDEKVPSPKTHIPTHTQTHRHTYTHTHTHAAHTHTRTRTHTHTHTIRSGCR